MIDCVECKQKENALKIERQINSNLKKEIAELQRQLAFFESEEKAADDQSNFQICPNVLVFNDNGSCFQSLTQLHEEEGNTDETALLDETVVNEIHKNSPTSPIFATEPLWDPCANPATEVYSLITQTWDQYKDNNFPALSKISDKYYKLVMDLCSQAGSLLSTEPLFLSLTSPVYVMGDIHGSFPDLNFFLKHLINFEHVHYTDSKMLFLGDYVDRGTASVEVAAMVLALKCMAPNSVFLLRGNHETVECNKNARFGSTSFLALCRNRFGAERGETVANAFNSVFAFMPMAAEVDNRIFCVHGGIPYPGEGLSYKSSLQRLRSADFPRLQSWASAPQVTTDQKRDRALALALLWADPAPLVTTLNEIGWAPNKSRGEDIFYFGKTALDEFCEQTNYEFIVRAHEVQQQGLRMSCQGKVVTVFTSSAYCGGDNGAGALFISHHRIKMISVKMRNEPLVDLQLSPTRTWCKRATETKSQPAARVIKYEAPPAPKVEEYVDDDLDPLEYI